MIDIHDEVAQDYLADAREHLAAMEANLLEIEEAGCAEVDEEIVNSTFRAVHSIKGGAGFFDLVKIRELAGQTGDMLELFRNGSMVFTPKGVSVLLSATDRLREMLHNPAVSNQLDIAGVLADLAEVRAEGGAENSGPLSVEQSGPGGGRLRALLVEDDFACRLLLQTFLSRYGECHVAVNGKEAVEAVRCGWERGEKYDLICMDIMMPEMDGCEAVEHIRAIEQAHGVLSTFGAKIIMTTAANSVKEVVRCFSALCDTYLIKPIALKELLSEMRAYRLVP